MCWTVLIAVLAVWDYWAGCSTALAIARATAGDSIDKDLLYRRWASVHSGVIPRAAEISSGPPLAHAPEKDIAAPAGKEQILTDPTCMTRQGYELGEQRPGERGHITSLRSTVPENMPDEWEQGALLALERGEKEVSSLEVRGSNHYFRLMRPLVVESGCLRCHAAQGYKEGDIRGGLSISVPWASSQEAINAHGSMMIMTYGGIWAIGCLGLWVFRDRVRRYLSDLQQSEAALRESEERHRLLFDQSRDALMTLAAPLWRFTAGNSATLRCSVRKPLTSSSRSALECLPREAARWPAFGRKGCRR